MCSRIVLYLACLSLSFCQDYQPKTNDQSIILCPSEQHLCWNNTDINSSWKHFEEKACNCDPKCQEYLDCCFDKRIQNSDEVTNKYGCVELPGSGNKFGVYAINKCLGKTNNFTRRHCEGYDEENENRTLYHYLPVYSTTSGRLYKNIYCAACNNDASFIKPWEVSLTCPDHFNGSTFDLSYLNYNKVLKKFQARVEDHVECHLNILDFLDWPQFQKSVMARQCSLAVSYCPNSSSPHLNSLCSSYSSYRYHVNKRNYLISVYKNPYCALCNSIPQEQLKCSMKGVRLSVFGPTVLGKSKTCLTTLLDFNFCDGNDVGNLCPEWGQLYDPLLKRCIIITCGEGYREINNECVPMIEQLNNIDLSLEYNIPGHVLNYSIIFSCPRAVLQPEEFTVLANYSVYINHTSTIAYPGEFELKMGQDGNPEQLLICAKSIGIFRLINFNQPQEILSQICLSLSILCLTMNLIIYSLLPSLRNLPGKNLMSMSSSLLLANILFLVGSHLERKPYICFIIGVFKHYAYLAVFFWTSIMAVDIKKTFTKSGFQRKIHSKQLFIRYSLYAWCSPILIVLAALMVDTFSGHSDIKPAYGQGVCWISHKKPLLIFFAAPVALLLFSNFVLFILTARNIHFTTCQTKIAKRYSEKIRFALYVKLATLLGLTWIFGFLAALANVDILWYPFIIFSGMQGVTIFVAFTLKPKIWRLLLQRFCSKDRECYLKDNPLPRVHASE